LVLSQCTYAALRRAHESAVRQVIATGRITTEADGMIDAAKANAMWNALADLQSRRHDA
jgi:hydroxymethylpyrimidine pyrophosphatase-like HAD family hydrolase